MVPIHQAGDHVGHPGLIQASTSTTAEGSEAPALPRWIVWASSFRAWPIAGMPISVIAVRLPTLRARLPRSRARDDRCGSIRRTVDALPESELQVAARRGDPTAFERLVSRYRRELYAHAYRMLGSVQDAEDALQESLLGAWRGLVSFEGRGSVCAWLYPITTLAAYATTSPRCKGLPIPMSSPRESRLHLIER